MSKLIDTHLDGANELVWTRDDVEVARLSSGNVFTFPPGALGGSLPLVTSGVTRDSSGRVTAYTAGGTSFTVGYDASTGLVSTLTASGVTRTISRDSSGLVTGVA